MIENQNKNPFLCGESKSASSQVQFSMKSYSEIEYRRLLPFWVLQEHIKDQIDFDCFDLGQAEQAEEIAMIIAEVTKLPASATVRIDGNDIAAELVAEIYTRLTHEHVLQVMENYAKATYEIKRTKTYIRTALYNSVLELTSRTDNQVLTAMPWLSQE